MYFKKYSPDGILVSFGYNNHNETTHDNYDTLVLPRLIYKLSDYNIKKIFCGNEHAFAINENNNLFSWGNNSNGQCGIEIKPTVKNPQKIKFENKEEIIMCSANLTSSLILTKNNNLYSCGLNYMSN
jgi:alpha-tubulin suppressor-like RCC1 family protein